MTVEARVGTPTVEPRALRWIPILLVALAFLVIGPPTGVTPESWRLLAIFLATIVGAGLAPLPLGAMVLLGVLALIATKTLSVRDALSGYADSTVWLVVCACFISRAVLVTGLGRRIAFVLIGFLGHHTIGLAYALIVSGALLSSVIPSSTARSGGIVYPVAVGICDAFDSRPGPSARRLGAYLMTVLYQADGVIATMFITGAASNFLKAELARAVANVDLTYALWAKVMFLPAFAVLLVLPLFVFWLMAPSVRQTPEAPRIAAAELARLGPPSYKEIVAFGVLITVTALWITQAWHGLDSCTVAFLGVGLLLVLRVVGWEEVLSDRGTWDIFVWYGGLLMMGTALGRSDVIGSVTAGAAERMAQWPVWVSVGLVLAGFFYAHYFFASVTAHAMALYGAFLKLLLAATMPPFAAAFALSACSDLSAGLTHYGSTTGPIYFGAGLVSQREWWRVGWIASLVSIVLWLAVAAPWWNVLGLW